MPNQHKTPMLGWHPPAELSAWVRAEAERRGVHLKVILDEALRGYYERVTASQPLRSKAHNLGFLEGTNAMQFSGSRRPERYRTEGHQFTYREWDEYQRGWDEALEAYDIDNA